MGLRGYRRTRRSASGPRFVIAHHGACGDHYALRLEIDGVLVSWAITNGASTSSPDSRIARRTEDHPLENAEIEEVVWDHGTYVNRTDHEATTCLGRGHLSFRLNGEKVRGAFALTRIRDGQDETWLLMKRDDPDAQRQPESMSSASAPDDSS
jgi:DNA ligase D-like protein (predicted 3'-phosphoesterase)